MNTNKYIVSNNAGNLTWEAPPTTPNVVAIDPGFIASICKQQCNNIGYSDVIDIVATVVVVLACVAFICRFMQFGYDFITDRETGSRIVPKATATTIEGFGLDSLMMLFGVVIGLVCAILWIVAIPLVVIVGGLFFARFLVRMNKKLSKL